MSYTLINDPLYGFVQITDPLIKRVIDHPYFQRLRRIKQMGMSDLIFPGANHTRFQHSLGTMHLAQKAIKTLERKDKKLSDINQKALQLAALLHDIGHGPFSHSSEELFLKNTDHENFTIKIVERLNQEFNGELQTALAILKGNHKYKFLSQLIDSQIDLDRLDYLNRDSYFIGMSRVNFDVYRIIEMIDVNEKDNSLVYEFKSRHNIERFLFDRRFMFRQVYGHKNNLLVDELLKKIWQRFKVLSTKSKLTSRDVLMCMRFISRKDYRYISQREIDEFSALDDSDMIHLIKYGKYHSDKILQSLCRSLLDRKFPKIQVSYFRSFHSEIDEYKTQLQPWQQNDEVSKYFVFHGHVKILTYDSKKDSVKIRLKNHEHKTLHELSEFFVSPEFSQEQHIYFLCTPK